MEAAITQLSVIIPLYNEVKRFPQAFRLVKLWYQRHPGWEFIIVNDGSNDATDRLVTSVIRDYHRIRLISYRKNRGKGYAIKRGIRQVRKPYVLFTDIDFSTPLSELTLLSPFLKRADLVIGTRKVKGATITKHQPKFREWLGRRFTDLTNVWLGMDISDYTCGFKLFR